MVEWSYYNKPEFKAINEKYLPDMGEGENRATQAVTAVNKLVYKWYNDGDVYDTTGALSGWANDLSSYANWLREYAGVADILDGIHNCFIGEDYEDLLKDLADRLLDDAVLERLEKQEKVESIYDAEGPYQFVMWDDDEEEDDWEEDEDE